MERVRGTLQGDIQGFGKEGVCVGGGGGCGFWGLTDKPLAFHKHEFAPFVSLSPTMGVPLKLGIGFNPLRLTERYTCKVGHKFFVDIFGDC